MVCPPIPPGGGFAASEGTRVSGLNTLIGEQLEGLAGLPDLAVLFVILAMMSATTQVGHPPK